MRQSISVKYTDDNTYRVMPRWRGRHLAVHAPVIDGITERKPNCWVITHLQSGYKSGGDFYGTLREATLAARLWDEMFGTVSPEQAPCWPMREQWKRIIRSGRAERPWRSIDTVREIMARA
jgi:hypothetical protein